MCKAHVLRFSCNHGVLMGLEPCNTGPCPVLKTTGSRLPQQPQKCYNCLQKIERPSVSSISTRGSSCRSSQESLTSAGSSISSASSTQPFGESPFKLATAPNISAFPGAPVKSSRCRHASRPSVSKIFSFTCNTSDHYATPHYTGLPDFLPHQDHSCPPCQLEELRSKSDVDVARNARAEYPNLKAEMLVRDGRIWEDWQSKPSLDKYVDEKRTEDREMWLHVTRKWTQDLKRARVLVSEEDGLGLMPQ